jgi:hypothetical protein
MRRLLALLSLTAIASCSNATDPAGGWTDGDTWAGQLVVTQHIDGPRWPSDPVSIISAEVRGDSLELGVQFGGGCRDHEFGLITNGVFAESYPVQTWVKLAHDANGDMCKALLSRVLRFDLSPLKALYNSSYQTGTGIMVIHITSGVSVTYSW